MRQGPRCSQQTQAAQRLPQRLAEHVVTPGKNTRRVAAQAIVDRLVPAAHGVGNGNQRNDDQQNQHQQDAAMNLDDESPGLPRGKAGIIFDIYLSNVLPTIINFNRNYRVDPAGCGRLFSPPAHPGWRPAGAA